MKYVKYTWHISYLIYTKNETDDNGNVTIYVASLNRKEDSDPVLGGVESDEEWARIKNVLKELSKPEEEKEENVENGQ